MSIIAYHLDRSRRLGNPAKPGAGRQAKLSPAKSLPRAKDQPFAPFSKEKPFQSLQKGWRVERRFSPLSVKLGEPESPDAPRVTQQRAAQGVHGPYPEAPACISDIFRLGNIVKPFENPYEIVVDSYPGVITLKSEGIITAGRNSSNTGRKSKIISFSRKSRNNLLKHFGMMEVSPEIWQTFTFADDVMQGKTIEERKDFSSYCLNRFEKFLAKHYPNVGMTWRREQEQRKRGLLQGEWCPHFHAMYYKPNTDPGEYMKLVIIFAQEWVRITGTKDSSALKVALHRKSYALLNNRTTAMKYVSKYMSKGSVICEEGQSIGRSWGIIGNIPMAEPEHIRLTGLEATMLLRFLRRYAKHKKSLVRNLRGGWVSTFVLISESTVERILCYIEDRITQEGRCLE